MATKEEQAHAAWEAIAKPVTEESFVAWYMSTHNKKADKKAEPKRPAEAMTTPFTMADPAKRQALGLGAVPASAGAATPRTPAASTPAASSLSKGKRTALLKAVVVTLKAAIKVRRTALQVALRSQPVGAPPSRRRCPVAARNLALRAAAAPGRVCRVPQPFRALPKVASRPSPWQAKKWHMGDSETLAGTTVCDPSEFAALFPGTVMSSKGGALTTFSLSQSELDAAFGELLKAKVNTFNHPRAFAKSFKTGSADLSFVSAEGKYSKGTSTLSLKFTARAGGGGGFGGFGGFGDDSDDGGYW